MPEEIERLKIFRESIVLPAYGQIKTSLEEDGHQVRIGLSSLSTSKTESPFSELMENTLMLSGGSSLSEYLNESDKPQWLLCSCLIVELNDIETSSKRPYANKFCMGLETRSQENGETHCIASIYCCGDGDEIEQFEENLVEGREQQDIAHVTDLDILTHFVGSYGAFRANRLSQISERSPEPLIVDLSPNFKEPEYPVEAQNTVITETTVTDQNSIVLEREKTVQEKKAAPVLETRAQQSKVQDFLRTQKLDHPIFKNLLPDDLKGLSELSDHLSSQRPQAMGEHQTVYDCLTEQASEFAFSLKPISGTEFADYLQLYRVMLNNDCRLIWENNPSKTYESIWIEQIKAYGEVDAPQRVKKTEAQNRRMMVQGVAQRFGKPDEFGQREWIGTSYIEINLPSEEMIRMIQMRNEQRQVRFGQLSYAILQMYQNGVHLPESERNLSPSIVHSYLQSLKLTIGQARSSEVESKILENGYEFNFSRVVPESRESVRAVARVRVTRPYGQVVLCSYEFKQA
jgi:hypothetical protein